VNECSTELKIHDPSIIYPSRLVTGFPKKKGRICWLLS